MMENDKDYEQKNLRGINKRVVNHYRQLMGGLNQSNYDKGMVEN